MNNRCFPEFVHIEAIVKYQPYVLVQFEKLKKLHQRVLESCIFKK